MIFNSMESKIHMLEVQFIIIKMKIIFLIQTEIKTFVVLVLY